MWSENIFQGFAALETFHHKFFLSSSLYSAAPWLAQYQKTDEKELMAYNYMQLRKPTLAGIE